MTEVKEKLSLKSSLDHILFANPVLVGGLVIGQIAAGATTLQNGIALTLTFAIVTIPVLIFAAALGKFLPKWLHIVVYACLSGALLFPAYMVCKSISPNIFDSIGIYLPLIAVTTVPVAYSAKFSERHNMAVALFDGIFLTVGFGLAAIILGALREFLGSGSLWGIKLVGVAFPALKLSSWGFILLGFMAAAISAISSALKRPEYSGFAVREEDEQ